LKTLKFLRTIFFCLFAFGNILYSWGQEIEKVESRNLPIPNATSHIFTLPVEILRDTIVSIFTTELQADNAYLNEIFFFYPSESDTVHKIPIVFSVEQSNNAMFGKKYFKKHGTKNDIYLHDFGDTWYSPIYHLKGRPLKYRTPFILKLQPIDKGKTRLTIVPEDPKVINGTSGFGPHGFIAREESVLPTSIEEHCLLLYIAENLGDKTVLPLKMPTP
jgi:hypothetical protein